MRNLQTVEQEQAEQEHMERGRVTNAALWLYLYVACPAFALYTAHFFGSRLVSWVMSLGM